MGVWDVVDREDWMSVIPRTWAFRIKRLPSGEIKKLKARLCIRGDKEIKNVHYWETYAPVVSWTTVRLLLILAAELELATRQVDYTPAFVHADVDTPPGFGEMSPEDQY
jgi:Reverse transcriptase (RNA-dependent DNA polymerase)